MRLPDPTSALALLASLGMHGGLLALSLSGGGPLGLPDGQVILTVDIVVQEAFAVPAPMEANEPERKRREDEPQPAPSKARKEDATPSDVPGESPPVETRADGNEIIGSERSDLVVAQGTEVPPAPAPPLDKPAKPNKPKAAAKPPAAVSRARRKAERKPKPAAPAVESKSDADAGPQAPPSPGEEVRRAASAGAAVRSALFFPPSMRDGLVALLQQQIERCYTTPSGASKRIVLPVIGIRLEKSGRLAEGPRVVRSGKTSVDLALAQAALAAVRRCAPYRIPAAYAPYYDTWRDIAAEFEFSGS